LAKAKKRPGPSTRATSNNGNRTGVSRSGSNGRAAVSDDVAEQVAPPQAATPVRRRRFTLKRVLIGIGLVALLLVLSGVGYAYWTVQKGLPTISGTVKFAGLSAPATITRDTYGVPHIVAANVEDLYAAQGYVHAQDRLFQMLQLRTAGQGRLAEVLSPAFVDTDRFLRTVGFHRAARAEWEQTTPEVRKALEAYARGINEFLRTHGDALPLEFNILGIGMEEWQPIDSLVFGKLQAWELSDSWDNDILAADLRKKIGPERAAVLLPDYPKEGPFMVPGANSGSLLRALEAYNRNVRPNLPNFGLSELGSNNWVIDGTKSATGKPLLANDPHLGVRNPSIWYQVHLSTSDGKYDAVGFSFAGVPGIITGHNRDIAWGVTNTGTDVQDLFLEQLDPQAHPGQYLSGDKWLPLQVVTETILVKGGEPITHTVRIVPEHGPLISDALDITSTMESAVGTQPFSLQWTASKPGRILEAVYDLQTASNWQQFRAALSKWTVPGQNFVYADREGNIGYQMTGEVPIRKKGDGSAPVPGWTGEYDWTGTIPFDDLPRAYNPPDHFIATANNKPFGPDYKHNIPGGWAAPWRAARIVEMLKEKDKLSADDFKRMLMDTRSPLARKVAPLLAGLNAQDEPAKAAAQMFKDWDGDLKADSTTAAIYGVFSQRVLSETFGDELGEDLLIEYLAVGGASGLRSFELLLDKPEDPFWDRTGTSEKEKRDDILLAALTGSLADLRLVLGDNIQEWQWGKIHTITPAHPFGAQPMLSGLFNLQAVPLGGDGTTVAVAPISLAAPFSITKSFSVRNHQSYRLIMDTSDWSKSEAIYATGQSGQPYSKHWGDMLPLWQKGEYNPLLYTKQDIDAKTEGVLTLTP